MSQTDQNCGNCRYFNQYPDVDYGSCRIRSTPTAFPRRDNAEWCGEWVGVEPTGHAKNAKDYFEQMAREEAGEPSEINPADVWQPKSSLTTEEHLQHIDELREALAKAKWLFGQVQNADVFGEAPDRSADAVPGMGEGWRAGATTAEAPKDVPFDETAHLAAVAEYESMPGPDYIPSSPDEKDSFIKKQIRWLKPAYPNHVFHTNETGHVVAVEDSKGGMLRGTLHSLLRRASLLKMCGQTTPDVDVYG